MSAKLRLTTTSLVEEACLQASPTSSGIRMVSKYPAETYRLSARIFCAGSDLPSILNSVLVEGGNAGKHARGRGRFNPGQTPEAIESAIDTLRELFHLGSLAP
jgi:hypothetical protein